MENNLNEVLNKSDLVDDDHEESFTLSTQQVVHENSDDDERPFRMTKKRIEMLSDSDNSDVDGNHLSLRYSDSDKSDEENIKDICKTKSKRIKTLSSSESEKSDKAIKNVEHQVRMKNKNSKFMQKFKGLVNSRDKEKNKIQNDDSQDKQRIRLGSKSNSESDDSDENDYSSINKIKELIKERSTFDKSCMDDPQTSDEENAVVVEKKKSKIKRKSTKLVSPKPMRMSAKEAMENMQKIKSESNRMLREKEVTLPYHRPKALSLKDIIGRVKPVISSNGKVLPLKMNNEQLKEYASILEQRQKQLIELCKSDTEEEDDNISDKEEKDPNVDKEVNVKEAAGEVIINSDNNVIEDTNTIISEINLSPHAILSEDLLETSSNKESEEKDCENKMEVSVKDNSTINQETLIQDHVETVIDSQITNNDNDKQELVIENIHESETIVRSIDKEASDTNDDDKQKSFYNSNDKQESVVCNSENVNDNNPEKDSQLISLHYSENLENSEKVTEIDDEGVNNDSTNEENKNDISAANDKLFDDNGFSDNDIDMDDIDKIIENHEINSATNATSVDSPMLIRDIDSISKPKLTGAPGMVIDLDGTDAAQPRKHSGVELLKQRFTFFAKLKTPEELERIRENKTKPGTQHSKLKQELEEQMAEQRTTMWNKRVEEEKQMQKELYGDEDEEEDDDIEKLEAKLEDDDKEHMPQESSDEEEPIENDVVLEDKPRKKNALLDEEAEESECDEDNIIDAEIEDNKGSEGDVESDSDSSDESSDDEENETTVKKNRILKAFEDSDDEIDSNENKDVIEGSAQETSKMNNSCDQVEVEDLQSGQLHKSISEDLFTSQEPDSAPIDQSVGNKDNLIDNTTGRVAVISEMSSFEESKLDDVLGMCTGNFTENIVTTQDIGEDVLAMCTGQFYDNQFVSQDMTPSKDSKVEETNLDDNKINKEPVEETKTAKKDEGILNSILEELNDPEFDNTKPNKFFPVDEGKSQQKKRFILDSDEEDDENEKLNKKKKKKLRDRALQISDDDLTEDEDEEENEAVTEIEDGDEERLVEYDSEENEVEILPQKKVKRKATEFFENEAELTSEDEWVGSGDEDEAGLDRMEREEGDDETFHEGKLQRELGQIHMRDVLDQDKREVRLLQELLFEDGDLGGERRQRKFRWREDDTEELASAPTVTDAAQSDSEGEGEEQWRRQRHERTVFLMGMQKEANENDPLNVVNSTTIINTNLTSKTMTSLQLEINTTVKSPATEKSTKDMSSPIKKVFPMYQQNYRGSLLSRGGSALARLASLAAPDDEDSGPRNVRSGGNFVFTTVSPVTEGGKKSKRKLETNPGTPQLLKKLKTDDKRTSKRSLIEHLQT